MSYRSCERRFDGSNIRVAAERLPRIELNRTVVKSEGRQATFQRVASPHQSMVSQASREGGRQDDPLHGVAERLPGAAPLFRRCALCDRTGGRERQRRQNALVGEAGDLVGRARARP